MDKKTRKKIESLQQRLQRLRQQLAGAKKQSDDSSEATALQSPSGRGRSGTCEVESFMTVRGRRGQFPRSQAPPGNELTTRLRLVPIACRACGWCDARLRPGTSVSAAKLGSIPGNGYPRRTSEFLQVGLIHRDCSLIRYPARIRRDRATAFWPAFRSRPKRER